MIVKKHKQKTPPNNHSRYLAEQQKLKQEKTETTSQMAVTHTQEAPAELVKKSAVAIVDFENWFISLSEQYGINPNIEGLFDELSEFSLREVSFIGDFSNDELAAELPRIRVFPVTIVDSRNLNPETEKEYSDTFVNNALYQSYIRNQDVDVIVLVSGDAHFAATCSFLKRFCHKEIIVYGVRGCIAQTLQMSATKTIEMPSNYDYLLPSVKAIFEYMRDTKQAKPYWKFFYSNTLSHVSENCGIPYNTVRDAFATMLTQGYLSKTEIYEDGRPKTIYEADWNRIYAENWLPLPAKAPAPKLSDSLLDYRNNGYEYTFKAVGGSPK